MSEAPTCCGHPMDSSMGGWTCMKCGHHVRPYPDDPETEPDPYTVSPDPYAISPDLSLELDEARARIEELEAERDAYRAGLEATTGSGPAVEITPEIPQSFFAGLADAREIQLAERDRQLKQARDRIAALEAERDGIYKAHNQTLDDYSKACERERVLREALRATHNWLKANPADHLYSQTEIGMANTAALAAGKEEQP